MRGFCCMASGRDNVADGLVTGRSWLLIDQHKGLNLRNIAKVITPEIEDLGYELVHAELARQGGDVVLRIYIDAPGGIRIDDCETVSNRISAILDVEDPIDSEYLLEVSSPGLDRPLVRPEHFQRFVGDRAKIVMARKTLGRRQFMGRMTEAGEHSVTIVVDGESFELPYKEMKSARLEPVL